MSLALALSLALWTAEPNTEQLALLKTFRSEFVALTPGKGEFPQSFMMGAASEETEPAFQYQREIELTPGETTPRRKVTMTGGFAVAKYEVPQNLWESVMGSNPSRWKGRRNSVEMLSFDESVKFCEKATELMRAAKLIGVNEVIRLPTEAEWEYAARAGTDTPYSFGNARLINDYAWHTGNAAGNDPPVGAKKPNPWGLYDMHGYLWEWCADAWHDSYKSAPTDSRAWLDGGDSQQRVLRSGSWKDSTARLTSAYRLGAPRNFQDDAVGLRCVLARGE